MSTECNRIAHQLASTINGDAWYGDSLQKMLNDVTAKQAQARSIPNAHSIWELLCHVDAWVNFTLGAVQGVPIPAWPGMPVELDWPAVTDTSERGWKRVQLPLIHWRAGQGQYKFLSRRNRSCQRNEARPVTGSG